MVYGGERIKNFFEKFTHGGKNLLVDIDEID